MTGGTRVLLAIVLWASAEVAHADEAADLVARGDAFAKAGEWSRAIQAFKQADEKAPRASNACRIGLAYTRRELWAQAELFFARCRARANDDDPVPDWLAAAEKTLGEKLATAGAAAITVEIDPNEPLALLSVSSFAPDETFSPRTFHLAPGTYTIAVSAPGFRPASETVTVEGAAKRTVKLSLVPVEEPGGQMPAANIARPSILPLVMVGLGGAMLAGGLAVHLGIARPARDKLDTDLNAIYDEHHDTFLRARRWTIVLYTAGTLVGITGLVWRLRQGDGDEGAHVALMPTAGGALVSAEWRR